MVDAALLSNYRKLHNTFRGSGLITNGNEYFLYIDLHKEEDIKEWQTPNTVSQQTDRGKNIIFKTKVH
ncbi:hypothetical protein [Peribacillus kribbensis]|uniref:hypothetical protein n=1 Tax=Peribacillus kribbensis TaxID=356658 RepID=UPI00041F36E5|nr:hypothetical protein [Peribacillus kribbensis]